MRDLNRFPVTEAEIVGCLRRLRDELTVGDDGGCGDMDPTLLDAAAEIVTRAFAMIRGIDARFADNGPRDPLRWVTPWKEAADLVEATRGRRT